jgi:hypothetical protein
MGRQDYRFSRICFTRLGRGSRRQSADLVGLEQEGISARATIRHQDSREKHLVTSFQRPWPALARGGHDTVVADPSSARRSGSGSRQVAGLADTTRPNRSAAAT